jgi:hypothetical protein
MGSPARVTKMNSGERGADDGQSLALAVEQDADFAAGRELAHFGEPVVDQDFVPRLRARASARS